MTKPWLPDRAGFAKDPGGYSMLAWMKWASVQQHAGIPVDPQKPPTIANLKDPVLWLSHSEALTEAAIALVRHEPEFANMPPEIRGVCDSQYCAVSLMLVGYSLEVCLKAMVIIREGIDAYICAEKDYKHHKLAKLASFIPDLTNKDKAILELLTHFVSWAGRYPDPGSGRANWNAEIFDIAEKNRISAKELFLLAAKVQSHVRHLIS